MNNEKISRILFFSLGIILTLLIITTANAFKSNKTDDFYDNINSNTLLDINTPTSELQQSQEITRNKPSPENFFGEEQIKVYKDKVIIDAKNIQWAGFEDTKSMLPVINKDSNALQVIPKCPDEIKLGDIISYTSEYAPGVIIHRVVFIGQDDIGTYFVMKGDNNPASDPGKIRCEQIQRKVVAIIY
ncbi:MAG: hypothetical protein WC758_00265 [Candidatus Woesearchaeota archaeon]|jgi:hypothetical protein